MEVDKKAKRILSSTYWEASGWKREKSVTLEDFAYAKAHGLMFDPVSMSHDQCVEDVRALSLGIGPQKAARAFLSSLSSRRLDWRSGFASYVMSTALEPHAFSSGVTGVSFSPEGQIIGSSVHCTQCGRFYGSPAAYVDEDLSVLNFERFKWGGVRHGKLLYAWLDLHCLAKEDIPEPTTQDMDIFRSLLATMDAIAPEAYAGTLEREIASLISSAKGDRQQLLEVLGCAGILKATKSRHNHRMGDWVYVAEWRGEDRYVKSAVEHWFGEWMQK